MILYKKNGFIFFLCSFTFAHGTRRFCILPDSLEPLRTRQAVDLCSSVPSYINGIIGV